MIGDRIGPMGIRIQFLGAVGTVTGSLFLVEAGGSRLVVDCGMFQGSPEEVSRNRLPFAFDPVSVDALLLTHAHLDHCGRTPALVRAGFRGPILATAATCDLTEIVLRDAAKLQAEAAERWRRRAREELGAEAESEEAAGEAADGDVPKQLRTRRPEGRTQTREPLYGLDDVERTVGLFHPVRYGESVPVVDRVSAVFHDAGHILGSAIIELRVADAGGAVTTVVFSGDLGRSDTPIVRDPTPLGHADFVLVESTYGNREHGPREEAVEGLVAEINAVAEARGVLLVPSFAIGRTQELVWVLDDLVRAARIPRLPLFVDSPMASKASDVYLRHPEGYDEETARLLRRGDSPLEYPGEQYTNTVEGSKAIRSQPRPLIVVASSGMLTGGRIMHHLKDFLPDAACTLLFIGYQGEGTLGRHLADGGQTARIDGQEYPVRCRIRTISGFSAHADEHELMAWLRWFLSGGATPGSAGRPQRVFAVHGDPDAAEALARRIGAELGLVAILPRYGEWITLA
jgi:metallo-beta-lactamase family protein